MIVLVALMGSILAGSIAIDTSNHEETAYNRLTDLGPIVEYDNVDTSIQYNPIKNVTGWTGVNYQTQSNPSIYTMQSPQTPSTTTTGTLGSMGGVYYADDAAYGYDGGFAYGDDYPYIVWSDMPTGTDPTEEQWPLMGWNPRYDQNGRSLMIGGYSQTWKQSGYRVDAVVTVGVRVGESGVVTYPTDSDHPYYWQDLARVAAAQGWQTGTVITASRTNASGGPVGVAQYYGTSFEGAYLQSNVTYDEWGRSLGGWRTNANLVLNIGWLSEAQYWWDRNTATFKMITGTGPDGLPQIAATSTPLVWFTHSLTDTLELTRWTSSNSVYVKPNTDVTINGDIATWYNGYDNDRVQMLMSPHAMIHINNAVEGFYLPAAARAYDMALVTLERNLSDSYWQGVINYGGPSDYTVLGYQRPVFDGTDFIMDLQPTLDSLNTYQGVYPAGSNITIHLDGFNQYTTVSGEAVLSGSTVTITNLQEGATITVRENIPGLGPTPVYTFTFSAAGDAAITAIAVSAYDEDLGAVNPNTRMAVVNTWVPADPNGLLWQDPSMNMFHYFGDLITTSGLRVTFGSVLSTGTALNICGRSYETGEGRILIDGSLYPINGLSIDIKNTDVVIYSNNRVVAEYEGDILAGISGTGVWMWSATLYEQTVTVVEQTDVHFGEGSSKNWMVFAFIGLCIFGIIVLTAWGRGSMDIWDWLVLGISVLLGLLVI